MTQLRIASLLVAVVAGAYAALTLIDCQLTDFGVAAALCAGSSVAAGLIAYADRRRRKAVARGRVAVLEGRDQQAAIAADRQGPLCAGAREKLDPDLGSTGRAACAPALSPEPTRRACGRSRYPF